MHRNTCVLRSAGILLMAAVCLALAPAANATTGGAVKVPFAFEACGKALPAGEYHIETDGPSGHFRLLDERRSPVMFLPAANAPRKVAVSPSAEFVRKGGKYVLAAVSLHDGTGLVRRVQIASAER